jgi:hypothetical protein
LRAQDRLHPVAPNACLSSQFDSWVTIDRLPVLFGYQHSLVLPDFNPRWVLTWFVATGHLFPSYWLAVAFDFTLASYY